MRRVFLALGLGLIALPALGLTGGEKVEQLNGKLDRYAALTQSGAAEDLKEAQAILDYFKKLIRMPSYMNGIRYSHDPAMGDEKSPKSQLQFIKTLLASMVSAQRTALGIRSPYSDKQREGIKKTYMGDRKTIEKLLASLQARLTQQREQASKQANQRAATRALERASDSPLVPREAAPAASVGDDSMSGTPKLLR